MITSFTVATGLYLEYWAQQASDADQRLFPGQELQLIVFTDQPDRARLHASALTRAEPTIIEVEPMGWPAATMRRYELIAAHAAQVRGSVLMHLDADMRIPGIVGPGLDPHSWRGGIALVRHPGYFRDDALAARLFRQPRRALGDLASNISESGLGQWERRPVSRAYVPRKARRRYVCGGVWFGRRDPLLAMCNTLAERMQDDLHVGLTARWHDESYLNWFAATNDVATLPPSYCFVHGLRALSGLPALIEAVDKGEVRVRE